MVDFRAGAGKIQNKLGCGDGNVWEFFFDCFSFLCRIQNNYLRLRLVRGEELGIKKLWNICFWKYSIIAWKHEGPVYLRLMFLY